MMYLDQYGFVKLDPVSLSAVMQLQFITVAARVEPLTSDLMCLIELQKF